MQKLSCQFPVSLLLGFLAVNKWAQNMATIAQLADGKGATFLDLAQKFLGTGGTLPKDLVPDLLHSSSKGCQVGAESMDDTLSAMPK